MAEGSGVGAPPRFDPDLKRFLTELRSHNNKAWFEANRTRYERVYKEAFAAFVGGFSDRLERISPHLVADPRPSGGSVMRIFRDTRFSKDKSPYRDYTVVHFGHEDATEEGAPGLYLYVAPDEVAAGGGVWHPATAAAQRIRSAIIRDPVGWGKVTGSAAFRGRFKMTGESLQRPPAGVPKDHPLRADLLRKDYVASTELDWKRLTSPRFPETYAEVGQAVAPMLGFLCRALDLPF